MSTMLTVLQHYGRPGRPKIQWRIENCSWKSRFVNCLFILFFLSMSASVSYILWLSSTNVFASHDLPEVGKSVEGYSRIFLFGLLPSAQVLAHCW